MGKVSRFRWNGPRHLTCTLLIMKSRTTICLLAAAGVMGTLASASAGVSLTPAAGFDISWDGNDGDNFDPTPPPEGALVPGNLGLATNGVTPISSSDLGPELGIGFHVAANLNDGFYGNSNSWIGGDANAFSVAFAGLDFGGTFAIESFAFGRDNGNGAIDDSTAGTDACGGQCDDRWTGIYVLQVTTDAVVNGDSAWTDVATLDYMSSDDAVVGGDFTGFIRHEYGVSLEGGGPIVATGLRLVVPLTGLGGGTAIDEIEVYGSVIPEPSSATLALLAGVLGLIRRRR